MLLNSGGVIHGCTGAWGWGGVWQQAKQAEALLRYLHVCPACPFSLLKLFVLSEGREEEIKNRDTSFARQVHHVADPQPHSSNGLKREW